MGNSGNHGNSPGAPGVDYTAAMAKRPDDRAPLSHSRGRETASVGRKAGLGLLVAAIFVAGTATRVLAQDDDVTALLRRAESGDARAAFVLGMRYAKPGDASHDDAQAVRWLRQAAERGLAEAQYNLGIMYAGGRGVEQDSKQAADWYRKAAEQGLANAQYNLGAQYAAGDGVARDPKLAAHWFERAALQDVPEAAYNLGVLYDLGRGVEPDAAAAMRWYERAAEQGYHPAASRLRALRAANPSLASKLPAGETPPVEKSDAAVSAKLPEASADTSPTTSPVASTVSAAPPPVEPADTSDAASGDAQARSASPWLARFEPRHYTLQVLSHTDESAVKRYLEEHFEDGQAGYFAFELDGKIWYSLVYGDFARYAEATAEGERLAVRLPGPDPWVRKFSIIQKAAIR